MKNTKRIFALLAAVVMILASLSVPAFALSAPPVPAKLSASANSTSVSLKWNKSSATGYRIYKLENKKYVKLATVRENAYTVKNLKAATSYVFAVRAYNRLGDKVVWSKSFSTVKIQTKAPGAITVKGTPADGKAVLSWTASAGAEGYAVFRYASKKWYKLAVVKANVRSYTVGGLKNGGTYTFAVRPFVKRDKAVVWGPLSKTVSVKPQAAPALSVQAICDKYNKAVNNLKAYQKLVKVSFADNSSINITDCSVDSLKAVINSVMNDFIGSQSETSVFNNGKNNAGETLSEWIWPYEAKSAIMADGVKSAVLSKKDGNTVISITLKQEKCYYNAKTGKRIRPKYNSQIFVLSDVEEATAGRAAIDYVNVDFTQTKLTAVLDAKGRLIKLSDNAPYTGTFTVGVPADAKKTSVTVSFTGTDKRAFSVKYY